MEASLSFSAPLLDLLFDDDVVARCLVAPDGTVLRVNAEWLRSTGFHLDDVLGADIIALFPHARDLSLALHARARAGHRVEVPRHVQWIHGRETWWEGSIAPVPMDGGTGLLVTACEATRAASRPPGDAAAASPSRELLAAVVEHSQTCIAVVTGHELRFTLVNPAYQAIAPGTPMLGRTYPEVFPEAAATGSRARFLRVLDTGEPWEVERWRAPVPGKPDATWRGRVVRLPAVPFEPPSALVVIEDITAQSRAEVALGDAQATLEAFFASSPGILNLDDDELRYVKTDALTPTYFGLTRESIVGRSVAELAPQFVEEFGPMLRRVLDTGEPRLNVEVHAPVPERPGEIGYWRASYFPVPLAGGKRGLGVVGVDITDLRKAEEALRDTVAERNRTEVALRDAVERYERQVRLFDGVASTTPDFVYLFDLQGRFLFANRRLLEVWGLSLEDALGKTCRELGYEQWHHDMHMREIAQVIATKRSIKGEVPFTAPLTGIYGVYEYIFTPVIGPDGEVEIIAGTTRDVTDRKRTEEALRVSEERLALSLEAARVGTWEYDPASLRADWSPLCRTLLGVGPDVPIDFDAFLRTVEPDDRQRTRDAVARALDPAGDGAYATQFRVRWPDGSLHWISALGRVHFQERDGARRPARMLGTVMDVTREKHAEMALREADGRKDQFLAVLSHELRNPLAPIRNGLAVLDRAAPGSAPAQRAREVLHRQTEQLTRLVDDLLDLSRITYGKLELQVARLDAREVVRRAYADAKALFEERRVDLVLSEPRDAVHVEADAPRLAQMLGNLLHNALKFTAPGGRVRIEISRRGERCEVAVRDTGQGLDPADLDRIFDPFVQAGRNHHGLGGLGLGLALVKELAAKHRGSVRASSEGIGKGAEFVVELPISTAPPAPAEAAAPAEAKHGLDILLVEDNADAAAMLADLLQLLGHRVATAATGREGVTGATERPPDVLICDVGLPDMSGYDVVRAVRSAPRGGAVFAIALTGYAQPRDRKEALAAGFDAHLPKPPPLDKLEALLADAARPSGASGRGD